MALILTPRVVQIPGTILLSSRTGLFTLPYLTLPYLQSGVLGGGYDVRKHRLQARRHRLVQHRQSYRASTTSHRAVRYPCPQAYAALDARDVVSLVD